MNEAKYDADFAEAQYRNSVINGRKTTLDYVIQQFEAQDIENVDSAFVLDAFEDTCVRDGLLHYLSNKCQIDLFGDEVTIRDCSDLRSEFMHFLMACGSLEHEKGHTMSPSYMVTICAIAMLNGETQKALGGLVACAEITEELELEFPSLGKLLLTFGAHTPDSIASTFRRSVESTDIIEALAGSGL